MNKKLTIGINASFIRKPNTGIGQVSLCFLKKLAKSKTEHNFILYLEEDLPKGMELPKNFQKRIFLPAWKRDDLIRKIWWEKRLLPKYAEKDGCAIFFSLYQCPSMFPKKIKHIMLVHDIIPKLFPEYLGNSRKKIYWKKTEEAIKKADKILAISRRTEKDLIHYLGIKPEAITVNHIDVDDVYKKKVSEEKNRKVLKKYKLKPGYILAGGGVEIRKNVQNVILSYKFLLDRKFVADLPELVVYGKLLPGNPLALDVQKLLKELNLTKKVKLLGMVPQENMPAIFQNSSMFVYPSFYEGFGLPVLEAMNLGKPVIASKVSSLPEVGRDGVLYCQPNDVYDITMVMKNVLSNRELRERLSSRALERSKVFSWGKFTKKFLNIAANK